MCMPRSRTEVLVDRRGFLRRAGALAAAVAGISVLGGLGRDAGAHVMTQEHDAERADPDAAIARLLAGNRRFVAGRSKHPRSGERRRRSLKAGQSPFAAIISCSDSRVPPNVIFDQGLGDLFVIRTAGNVAGPDEVASLAYAVEHTGVDVVLVMGHEECGAVKATIDVVDGGPVGEYAPLVDPIRPAVLAAQQAGMAGADLVGAAVTENVRLVTAQVPERSQIIRSAIDDRGLAVVGAVYDLDTGKVSVLS